ncbi:beta-N-acetylhexosaminidase, partial [Leptospira borgpetersenii serovar Ballum]|nr:beta-N-acetylhexosaminidase [Leptospira borgpetersenii serovar Ballum]
QSVPTPRPVKVRGQDVPLEKHVHRDIAALEKPAQEAIFARFALLGIKTDAGYPVRTAIASHAFSGKEAVSGAYQLHIGQKEATITGYDRAGVFYALQSLLSLIPAEGAKQIATL